MTDQDTNFRGHYEPWIRKRIAFIESTFGHDWFQAKRVLELGCGYADIGAHFARLGAQVTCSDARIEHLQVVAQRHPEVQIAPADLNSQWPFEGEFDLILHLGLLYHLEDIHFSLQRCFEHANHVVLETEVLDSLDDQAVLRIDENQGLYDQSFTGHGSRPTAGYLERLFATHGFHAFRLSSPACNASCHGLQHVYDWPSHDTNTWHDGLRRLWVLRRKSLAPPVTSKNISVVVQGPISGAGERKQRRRLTERCIASVRRHLPEAELVLSTWADAPVAGLDRDVLVQSDDPGALQCDDVYRVYYNLNRQVVSSAAGLARCSRPYCLKLRSDLILTADRFLQFWGKFDAWQWSYKFTAERILAGTVFARRFAGTGDQRTRIPFHPSDFLFFGFRQDLRALFDIPTAPDPETARWFQYHHRPAGVYDCYPHALCRFFPEQQLWTSYLRKFLHLPIKDRLDLSNPCLRHDVPSLVNNLVMLDQDQWTYELPKYSLKQFLLPANDWDGLIRHAIWLADYQRLCAPDTGVSRTFDSRARWIWHDNHVMSGLRRLAPHGMNYVYKKVRKGGIFR